LLCHNGAKIQLLAAHQAERFRGPQADGGWVDEIDAWKPEGMTPLDALDLFLLGIRLGPDPRVIATTTPKANRLVKQLKARDDVVITGGSTWENAPNLAPQFLASLEKYKGTRLERQELKGELIEDVEGALVTLGMIDVARVAPHDVGPIRRVVVGVDPSGSIGGDRQGIIVAGLGADGNGYVLADRSCSLRPAGWGRRAVDAALEFGADRIIAETNYGGDMVKAVIDQAAKDRGATIRVRKINASRGKVVRFDPVSLLYERGKIRHVGVFETLESELCAMTADGYEGDGSPDGVDALVWAVTDLQIERRGVSPSDEYGEGVSHGVA
jgi:phage terminase large subunit-like protein